MYMYIDIYIYIYILFVFSPKKTAARRILQQVGNEYTVYTLLAQAAFEVRGGSL